MQQPTQEYKFTLKGILKFELISLYGRIFLQSRKSHFTNGKNYLNLGCGGNVISNEAAGGGGHNALYPIKALDFGCGIGRQSMLMSEFGIETCGIDISEYAISQAKRLAQNANLDIDFRVYDGEHIPFKHNTFDFTISYGVLDSLPFDLAQNLVSQIAYVSKTYFFCSLIGEDSTSGFSNIQESTFTDEIEVQESHEKGTIQSFFDYPKIQRLFKKSTFEIIWGEKKSSVNLIDGSIQSRYYIVCKKAEYEQ